MLSVKRKKIEILKKNPNVVLKLNLLYIADSSQIKRRYKLKVCLYILFLTPEKPRKKKDNINLFLKISNRDLFCPQNSVVIRKQLRSHDSSSSS